MIPDNSKDKVKKSNQAHYNPSPFLKANLFSKIFFCWISPLLKIGYKKPLEEEDLYSPIKNEESKYLTNQIEEEWNKELLKLKKNQTPSLAYALIRVYWLRVLVNSLYAIIEEAVRISQPLLISGLLKYFIHQSDFNTAIYYGIVLSIGVAINCVTHHVYYQVLTRCGMQMRISCSGLIYKRIFKLKLSSMDGKSGGQILNLLTNDLGRLEYVNLFVSYIIIGPLQSLLIIYLLIRMIDVTVLSGLIIMILVVPTQAIGGKIYDHFRRITSKKCDKRIDLLTEVLNGIKIVKMYCWESPFKILIDQLRKRELVYQRLLYLNTALNSVIHITTPTTITFLSITFFVFFTNKPLEPSYIVLAMSFYRLINDSLFYCFTYAVTSLIGANVSIKRIQAFLLQENIQNTNDFIQSETPSVDVRNLTVCWKGDFESFGLKNMTFKIDKPELVSVIGPVGSGKSSLLMALLGELHKLNGDLDIKGSVFYVSQEPWIFTDTIRQNILFGNEFIKDKYDTIVKVCCLEQDFKMFSNYDLEMIGEKGINLSGGQRARIALARALYSDAQIYLMDDPLSAVDANVANLLFKNCINGYLKSKIRILVTHQVQHLKDADRIIVLNNGQIESVGTHEDLSKSLNFDTWCDEEHRKASNHARHESISESLFTSSSTLNKPEEKESLLFQSQVLSLNGSKLTFGENEYTKTIDPRDEKHTYGSVSWKTYLNYFRLGAGCFGSFVLLAVFILSQFFIVYCDYWLSKWSSIEQKISLNISETYNFSNSSFTNTSSGHNGLFADRIKYYTIYSSLVLIIVVISIVRILIFLGLCIRTSRKLHKSMFDSVMSTAIRFFDLNPIGRIMNRFSKDVGQLDEQLPNTLLDLLNMTVAILGSIVFSVIIIGWIFIPLIPLAIILFYVRRYFLKSSMEIKRLDGLTRSPVYVCLTNTISGLATIRANRSENKFYDQFTIHLDNNTRATAAFINTTRWFGSRLDWIAAVYVFITIFSCILLKNFMHIDSGVAGLLFVYLFNLIGLFQWCVRQSCDVENQMIAVERILEYSELPGEPLETGKIKPATEWPQQGKIVFNDVSFSYDRELPYVLKNLTFTIKAKEKIGIVGRTGAGKSSLIQTLFRMAEPDGAVLIDNVNIKDISLHDLRSKISIIPQEPTLFIGTVRSNLDPFHQYTDKELWDALEQVQLKETVADMKAGLDAEIQKAGSNLSVGQKQLVCLARAILKKSKILIIDEATANVDFKTDELVQKAIRECFSECTVLTIAHRLQTIIDNDRILCLNKGKMENFDHPYDLIMDKSTIFHQLIFSLEANERTKLISIAKRNKKAKLNET